MLEHILHASPDLLQSIRESYPDLNFVLAGTDTFSVNYKFVDARGDLTGNPLPDRNVEQLDEWQKAARKDHIDVATDLTFRYMVGDLLTEQSMYMRPHGSGIWSWMLYCEDLKLYLSHGTLNKGLFCQARFSAHLLWTLGADRSIIEVESLLHEFIGESFHEQASEVHLCLDMQGFDFSKIQLHNTEHFPFVSRVTTIKDRPVPPLDEELECGLNETDYKNIEHKIEQEKQEVEHFLEPSLTTAHRRIETLDFGSHASKLSAQIYNKTAEIKKHKKQWFEPLWAANSYNPELTVWRLEFRFKRDFLHDFGFDGESGLDGAFDILNSLGALWKYATEEWLRFVDVTSTEDSNTSRRPTHLIWQAIQQAYTVDYSCNQIDLAAEEAARIAYLLQEKPLQVIKQAEALLIDREYQPSYDLDMTSPCSFAQLVAPVKDHQTRILENFTEIEKTFGTDPRGIPLVEKEVLQQWAQDELSRLSADEKTVLLDQLSPRQFQEVQTALVKRARRIAKRDALLASAVGFFRSFIALSDPEDMGEISTLSGKRVRQPDLLSCIYYFAQQAKHYDEKKNRVHIEEILKKRVKNGIITASQLYEEVATHGVDLTEKDWSLIDAVTARFAYAKQSNDGMSLSNGDGSME